MRVYLTHCSAEKDLSLNESGKIATPDQLYTEHRIQQFMARCKDKNVSWAILSDLYGVYLSSDQHGWYEKYPEQ
ncbi:hypothetical protein IFO70_16450 [Phormidium tenue FACHB-886]|nr:hypothetical protein [Phormidium tenue FACHB-886]